MKADCIWISLIEDKFKFWKANNKVAMERIKMITVKVVIYIT